MLVFVIENEPNGVFLSTVGGEHTTSCKSTGEFGQLVKLFPVVES